MLKKVGVVGFSLLLGITSPSRATASFENLNAAQCGALIQMIGKLSHLAEIVPVPQSQTFAFKNIIESDWAPDFIKQLAILQSRFQPQLDSIQFIDSEALTRLTALQLKALGVRSAEHARAFLSSVPNLPNDRRLSFVHGLIFRLLTETRNRFSDNENRARLGLSNVSYAPVRALVVDLDPTETANLTFLLLCHFAYRADTAATRLTNDLWAEMGSTAPMPIEADRAAWIHLHGTVIDPRTGASLFELKDIVSLVATLTQLEAKPALEFFLFTEIPHLNFTTLDTLARLTAVPESVRTRLSNARLKAMAMMEPSNSRLLEATRSELEVLNWVEAFHGMGGASALLEASQWVEGAGQSVNAWIQSSVEMVLWLFGVNTHDEMGRFLSAFFSQSLVQLCSNSSYGPQLQQLFDQMKPIAQFAQGLPHGAGADTVFSQRRQNLQLQLHSLRPTDATSIP